MDYSHVSLSMGFPRQGYLNGLPFPSSGDLSDPGIKPVFPAKHIYIYVCMYTGVTKEVKIFYLPVQEKTIN